MVCSLLFNVFYNITDSVRSIVAYQKMYMVFISLHGNNPIALRIADIVYRLFYIVSYRTFKYLLAVLCNKNYVHFQTVFASVMTVISITL